MISPEFKRFPNEWKVLPFLEVFEDVTSKGKKVKKENYQITGDIPVVDQGQKFFGGYTDEANKITGVDLPAIVFGDHTKAFKYVEVDFAIGADGVKLLNPKIDADKKFLFYYLKQLKLEDAGYSRHFKFLKETYIPLPPLETQKKIAAVLEKADQLRKDCQQMEQELNSLAQSVFIDMFGDVRSNSFNSKKVKFDDIFEINSKLVDPRLPEFENLPHIGPEHLEKRTGRILPYRTAKEDALVSGKFNFQKGCVLFSKIRPNLKKVAIPEFSGLCSADMYPLEVIDGVSTREFIWGLILSDAFDDYLETLPSRANIPKINRKELAAFEFYLPDLRDQKAYSKKLAKIQEQLKQNACLYQETENNFNALIQKAFKGELTL